MGKPQLQLVLLVLQVSWLVLFSDGAVLPRFSRNKNPPLVQTLVRSRKLSSQNGPAQNLTYYERNEDIPPLFLANSEHYYKQIIGPNYELNQVRKKSKFQDVQNHHHKTGEKQLFRNKRNSYYKTFDSIEKLQYKFLNNSEQKNVNGETPLPTSDYDADDEDIDIKGGTLSEYEQKCVDHLCHTLEKNREFDLGENSQGTNKTFIESLYLEFVSEDRSKKANKSTSSKEKFKKMLQEMCCNGKHNNTERQRQKRTSNTNLQLAVVIPLVSEENCTEAPKFKRCIKKLCKSSMCKNIHGFKSKNSHHVDIPVYSYESEYDERAAIKQPSWIDPQNHTLRSPHNYSQLRESKIIEFPTQYPKAVSKEMRDNTYRERDKYFQNNIKSFPHENQNYKVPSKKDNYKFFYNEPRDYDTSISSLQSQFEAKTHELKKVLKDRREKLRNKKSSTQQKMLQKNLFLPFQQSSEDEILKYSPLKHHKFLQKMQNRNDETHKVYQKNFTKNMEKENFAVPLEIEQARSQTPSQHVIDYMWTNNGEQLTPVSSDMNTRAPSQKAGVIKYDRQNVNKHQSPRTDSSSQSETTQESFLPSFQPSMHAIKSTEYDNLSENFGLKDYYSSKEQDQISPLTSDHMPNKYHPPKYQYVNQASNTENDRLPLSSTLNGINTYPEANNKPHNVLFPKKQLQKEAIQSNEKADILQQLNIKDIYRNLPPDFELSAGQWIHVQPSETIQRRREPDLNLMGKSERDINFKIPENEEDLRELEHLAKESEIRNLGRNKDPSDTRGYRAEYSNTNTSKTGSDTAPSFRQQSGHLADDNRISRLKNALKLTTQEILSSLDSPYITGHKYPGFTSQLEKPKNDFDKIEYTPHSSEVSDKISTQKIQHMHNGSKKSANIQTEDVNKMDILHFSTNNTDQTSPSLPSNLDYEERERTVANWTFRSLNSLYPPVTETYSLFPYLSANKSDLDENTSNELSRDNKNQTPDYLDDSKENTQMSTNKADKEHKYQYDNDNHKYQLTIHDSVIEKETDKIEQIRTEETPQWSERNSRRNVTKFASDSKLLQQENDVASWNDSSHAVVDILTKILEKPEQEVKSESTTLHSGITSTTKSEKESSITTNKEISSDFRSSGTSVNLRKLPEKWDTTVQGPNSEIQSNRYAQNHISHLQYPFIHATSTHINSQNKDTKEYEQSWKHGHTKSYTQSSQLPYNYQTSHTLQDQAYTLSKSTNMKSKSESEIQGHTYSNQIGLRYPYDNYQPSHSSYTHIQSQDKKTNKHKQTQSQTYGQRQTHTSTSQHPYHKYYSNHSHSHTHDKDTKKHKQTQAHTYGNGQTHTSTSQHPYHKYYSNHSHSQIHTHDKDTKKHKQTQAHTYGHGQTHTSTSQHPYHKYYSNHSHSQIHTHDKDTKKHKQTQAHTYGHGQTHTSTSQHPYHKYYSNHSHSQIHTHDKDTKKHKQTQAHTYGHGQTHTSTSQHPYHKYYSNHSHSHTHDKDTKKHKQTQAHTYGQGQTHTSTSQHPYHKYYSNHSHTHIHTQDKDTKKHKQTQAHTYGHGQTHTSTSQHPYHKYYSNHSHSHTHDKDTKKHKQTQAHTYGHGQTLTSTSQHPYHKYYSNHSHSHTHDKDTKKHKQTQAHTYGHGQTHTSTSQHPYHKYYSNHSHSHTHDKDTKKHKQTQPHTYGHGQTHTSTSQHPYHKYYSNHSNSHIHTHDKDTKKHKQTQAHTYGHGQTHTSTSQHPYHKYYSNLSHSHTHDKDTKKHKQTQAHTYGHGQTHTSTSQHPYHKYYSNHSHSHTHDKDTKKHKQTQPHTYGHGQTHTSTSQHPYHKYYSNHSHSHTHDKDTKKHKQTQAHTYGHGQTLTSTSQHPYHKYYSNHSHSHTHDKDTKKHKQTQAHTYGHGQTHTSTSQHPYHKYYSNHSHSHTHDKDTKKHKQTQPHTYGHGQTHTSTSQHPYHKYYSNHSNSHIHTHDKDTQKHKQTQAHTYGHGQTHTSTSQHPYHKYYSNHSHSHIHTHDKDTQKHKQTQAHTYGHGQTHTSTSQHPYHKYYSNHSNSHIHTHDKDTKKHKQTQAHTYGHGQTLTSTSQHPYHKYYSNHSHSHTHDKDTKKHKQTQAHTYGHGQTHTSTSQHPYHKYYSNHSNSHIHTHDKDTKKHKQTQAHTYGHGQTHTSTSQHPYHKYYSNHSHTHIHTHDKDTQKHKQTQAHTYGQGQTHTSASQHPYHKYQPNHSSHTLIHSQHKDMKVHIPPQSQTYGNGGTHKLKQQQTIPQKQHLSDPLSLSETTHPIFQYPPVLQKRGHNRINLKSYVDSREPGLPMTHVINSQEISNADLSQSTDFLSQMKLQSLDLVSNNPYPCEMYTHIFCAQPVSHINFELIPKNKSQPSTPAQVYKNLYPSIHNLEMKPTFSEDTKVLPRYRVSNTYSTPIINVSSHDPLQFYPKPPTYKNTEYVIPSMNSEADSQIKYKSPYHKPKYLQSSLYIPDSAERHGSNLLEKGAFSTTPDLTNEHLNQWKNQDITQTSKTSENIDSTLISNQPPTQDDPRMRNNSEIPKTGYVKTSNNLHKSMHNLMKIPTLESISHPEMRSKDVDFANDQSLAQSFSIETAPNINFNTDEAEYSGTMLIVDPNTGAVTETIPVSGRLLTLNLQQEGNLPPVFLNTQNPENASPYNPHIQAGSEKYQATSQGELGYSLYPEVNIISNSPSATLAGIPQSNQERSPLHEFETLRAADQLAGGGDRKEMVEKEIIQVPQNLNMQSNHDPFPGTTQNNPSKESLYERHVSSSFLTDHTDISTDEKSADSQNQETNDLTISVYPEVDLSCHETDLACKKARDDVYGKFFSVMLKEMQTLGNDTCTESCINSKFIPACEQCIKKLLYEKESDDTVSEEVEKFAAKYCPPKNVIEKHETSTGEASSSSYNKCKYKFIADLTSLFSLWLRAVSNSR